MPGIYLHLYEAKHIINHIQQHINKPTFTHADGWCNDFTLGCVLTDATPREFKYKTHFWHPNDWSHVVIAPTLSSYIEAYPDFMSDPIQAGYLCHLHLDRTYFKEFLPNYVDFMDKDGKISHILADVTTACIKKTGERMPVRRFFSEDYFYGDYSRMNMALIHPYHLSFPEKAVGEWTIRETNLENYHWFIPEAEKELRYPQRLEAMRVFDHDDFMLFLDHTGDSFVQTFLNAKDNDLSCTKCRQAAFSAC